MGDRPKHVSFAGTGKVRAARCASGSSTLLSTCGAAVSVGPDAVVSGRMQQRSDAGGCPAAREASEARPFLKWAGGKGQLLDQLWPLLPERRDGHYFEPFVGGAAL